MSNGQRCCILHVCCPPPGNDELRIKALRDELNLAFGKDPQGVTGDEAARYVIENYDLVPKGVGAAIVEAYRPEFAKLHAHHVE